MRERHYIITLQRARGPVFDCSTQNGIFEGDDDEEAAFRQIWAEACRRTSEMAPSTWTTYDTSVLFYRLVDMPPKDGG